MSNSTGNVSNAGSLTNPTAIRRLLYLLNCVSPEIIAEGHEALKHHVQYLAPASQKRVWYCFSSKRKGSFLTSATGSQIKRCISYDPPEFRLIIPSLNEKEVIVDVPPYEGPLTLLTYLEELLTNESSVEEQLLQDVRNLLLLDWNEALDAFWHDAFRLASNENLEGLQIGSRLYRDYYENFRLPGAVFSAAVVLGNLQWGTGKWIAVDEFKDPLAALKMYIRWCSFEWTEILQRAVEYGNNLYDQGNNLVNQALDSTTLDTFYRLLYCAHQNFFSALLIAHCLDEVGTRFNRSELEYDTIRADEGCANTITGLGTDIEHFLDGEYPTLEKELLSEIQSGNISDAKNPLRDLTRPTNPILPLHYAQVSFALAKIKAGEDWLALLCFWLKRYQEIQKDRPVEAEKIDLWFISLACHIVFEGANCLEEGVAELEKLESEFWHKPSDMSKTFELDRILQGLIRGYYFQGKVEQHSDLLQFYLQTAQREFGDLVEPDDIRRLVITSFIQAIRQQY